MKQNSSVRVREARRAGLLAAICVALSGILAAPVAAQPTNGTEAKCQAKLAKSVGKVWKTAAKGIAKCRDAEIAGKGSAPCPDAKGQTKIDKAVAKVGSTAAKSCGSVCSESPSVACLSDITCPPNPATVERCTGDARCSESDTVCADDSECPGVETCEGGTDPFSLSNLGFPGAFCPGLLVGAADPAADLAQCLGDATELNYEGFFATVYGSIDSGAGISSAAGKCLQSASKAVQKAVNSIYKAVTKCRDAVNKGKLTVAPARCKLDDPKTEAAVTKALEKLDNALAGKCDDGDVAELDICGNGAGGTLTTAEARACLGDAAEELSDTLDTARSRDHVALSLVDVMFPPSVGVCGDGVANQLPDPFLPLGEECDRGDDDACPGECLPPGDLFECTCGNVKRMMNVAIGAGSDLDIGWTGFAHNKEVMAGASYVVQLKNCDCDDMDGAECVGNSTDSVCDLDGTQLPTCSWELFGETACDARGDSNGTHDDSDCFICDALSANAGDACGDDGECQSQCYDGAGTPTGPCAAQADCGAGEVCRGRCDTGQVCIALPHGPAIPLVSGGAPSCLLSPFTGDVTGTTDIVTGEHERDQFRRTIGHIGEAPARPCPICGGYCDDTTTALSGRPCEGTCSISADRCRFDDECPEGETCTTAAPECGPGFCNLELLCFGGALHGSPCRVHGAPGPYGTTSTDCPVNPILNFSGPGTPANFEPSTSELVALDPAALPCSAPQFELYDCPCPDDGGAGTQPNRCAFACNAGAELDTGCATRDNPTGAATRCVGGVNDEAGCDEDADCAPGGGTCSGNPTHCVGDPDFELAACDTSAECGTGTCVDACPSGRCVQLCRPKAADPEDGECIAGPSEVVCSNERFRACSAGALAGTCDAAVCATSCDAGGVPTGGSMTSCTTVDGCPGGEVCCGPCTAARACEAGNDGILGTIDDVPGAGMCSEKLYSCYLPDLAAEGGDIFNGKGGPVLSRSVAVYCTEANVAPVANFSAGLGGPGRIRSDTVNLTNGFETLP